MTIDVVASEPHFLDHIAPIALALGDQLGTVYTGSRPNTKRVDDRWGLTVQAGYPHTGREPCLVANVHDLTQVASGRPAIFVEHGAGQTYTDGGNLLVEQHPSYAGGDNRHAVRLFLAINETTAAKDRARYPDARVEVVGSPWVDHLAEVRRDRYYGGLAQQLPIVAFCWHYDLAIVPETRSARSYWWETMRELHADGEYLVAGSGHPRAYRDERLAERYQALGIPSWADLAQVVAHADVLCFDNTSAGFEAMAAGVPVVALNAPWYRKDVHHGLRFWEVPDLRVDDPDRLRGALRYLSRPTSRTDVIHDQARDAARIFAHQGSATERAVAAIERAQSDGILGNLLRS